MYSKLTNVLPLCLSLFLVSSCSDDTENPDPNEGKAYKAMISAATGGSLATDGDTAKLMVPANALAADTELTLEVMAAASGSVTSVFDFGPDGTTFTTPATLTIKHSGTPEEGFTFVLGELVDGTWKELPGSSFAGGVITGSVSHFSKLGGMKKAIATIPAGCTEAGFTSCLTEVGEGCWNPSGECTVKTSIDSGDVEITWADKSVIKFTGEMNMTGDMKNASGQVCATAEITIQSGLMTEVIKSNGKEYTLEMPVTPGDVKVTCPDGSTETVTQADFVKNGHCFGQGGGETCKTEIEGGCETEADCDGQQCCDLGEMKMCMPTCPGGGA